MNNQNKPDQESIPAPESQPKPEAQTSASATSSNPTVTLDQTKKPNGRKWKKWILIGGVILIILLTGTAYALSQQKSQKQETKTVTQPTVTKTSPIANPTAGWKKYESKRFRIEFRYPSKYVLVNEYENTEPDKGFISLFTQKGYESIKTKPDVVVPDSIQLFITRNPKKLSAFEWTKSDSTNSNFTYSQEIIAGENALTHTAQDQNTFITKVIAKDEYIYNIYVNGNSDMIDDFNQILSTFKFTEPTSLSCTPRPACLDADPPCLMPENANMCPKTPIACPAMPVCKEGEQLMHGDPGPDSPNKCPIYKCVNTNGTTID
ncbi:MAG TPA: hypothetical protein VM077_05365 [Candidatus Limnocylindrales bacterium]|nr:hypothetical protein [Candidatus Limnocylindrales bacterium]